MDIVGQSCRLYSWHCFSDVRDAALSPATIACADVVMRYTAARAQQEAFPLASEFLKEALTRTSTPGSGMPATFVDAWRIVQTMVAQAGLGYALL